MNYTYSEGYDANDKYYSKVTATNAKGAVSEEISDANGKVIKVTDKGTSGDTAIEKAYEYDARGNLVKEIHSAGDCITYSYDSLGRVTEKQQYSSAGAQLYRTVYTYYSGLNLVKDMKDYEAGTLYCHTYYEYDSLGRISAKAESNSEMTDAEKAAKAVSYTYNLRGEVTGTGYGSSLTNIAAGEISGTRYEYNSYGQLTGLLYLNARFYDPATGRFISQDTYRGERDDTGTWHLYAYCANDPVNYVDPSGHKKITIGIDVTNKLNRLMLKNAKWLYNYASSMNKRYGIKRYQVGFVGKAFKAVGVGKILNTFIGLVKSGGEWDLKVKKEWKLKEKECFLYNGKKKLSDDIGNIHFGYVGSVLFRKTTLCAGAGMYQIYSGTSDWKYISSYFDDPRDSKAIKLGVEMWKKYYKKRIF